VPDIFFIGFYQSAFLFLIQNSLRNSNLFIFSAQIKLNKTVNAVIAHPAYVIAYRDKKTSGHFLLFKIVGNARVAAFIVIFRIVRAVRRGTITKMFHFRAFTGFKSMRRRILPARYPAVFL
jgi:hypothetical protein